MARVWLLIDCSSLLHRAWHTTGTLEHNNQPTGVIFGFLNQVRSLQSRFQTERVAFAFDSGRSLRAEVCKTYKANRKRKPRTCAQCFSDDQMTQCNRCAGADRQDAKAYGEFKGQCRVLRDQNLPALGHRNVFWADGYEADDVLASLVKHSLREQDEAVLVSSDHDLFQLLEPVRVSQWLPHKKELYRAVDFVDEHGVDPFQWPDVMAIAGCPGDGVIGVPKVGCKTAAKHLRGELNPRTQAWQAIRQAGELASRNLPLVKLPYKGCPRFKLRKDECTPARWRAVCKELGFNSLLGGGLSELKYKYVDVVFHPRRL